MNLHRRKVKSLDLRLQLTTNSSAFKKKPGVLPRLKIEKIETSSPVKGIHTTSKSVVILKKNLEKNSPFIHRNSPEISTDTEETLPKLSIKGKSYLFKPGDFFAKLKSPNQKSEYKNKMKDLYREKRKILKLKSNQDEEKKLTSEGSSVRILESLRKRKSPIHTLLIRSSCKKLKKFMFENEGKNSLKNLRKKNKFIAYKKDPRDEKFELPSTKNLFHSNRFYNNNLSTDPL